MDFDDKLVKNVADEINRLKTQLTDLELYKNELSQEEIDSIRQETLQQLIDNTKMLEKMKSGDITTKTTLEDTQMKLNALLCENFNVKELLNSYLANEVTFLREKLSSLLHAVTMNKISNEEYQSSAIQILELISKNTNLNDDEKKLYDSMKSKVMSDYQVDSGIDKSKIEKTLKNK